MKAEVVTITPTKATKILERNTGNFRKPCVKRVESLAKAMKRGEWDLNGESIKIAHDGVLLDGQHRLLAVVSSGIAVQSLVVTGVQSDARAIDRGQSRTLSQWMAHNNIPNAKQISAIARWSVCHDKGMWARESASVSEIIDSEIIEYEQLHHDELQDARKRSEKARNIVPHSILGTVVHVGTRGADDLTVADWFCHALTSGEDLTENDAILHLRNRLLSQSAQSKVSRTMLRALVTLAWNKTVKGEGCTSSGFRFRVTGPKPQKYPDKILSVMDYSVVDAEMEL